MTGYL